MSGSRTTGYASASWRTLGTYVGLVVADPAALPAARAEAERLLAEVDLACSRFREDSDLVRANAAAGRWVKVHPLLVEALTAALWAAEQTDGLVDPTIGASLAAVGYDRDLPLVQRAGADPAGLPLPLEPGGWRAVGVDADGAVRVPAGVALDLGATGKAFAADLVASTVGELTGAIVSLGGDVAIGVGPEGPVHPWQVAVAELPEDADGPDAELVELGEGAVATSSTVRRRWRRGGQELHHLLDPRTGRPAEQCWRTVTVTAAGCVAANAASTASVIMGERAPQWLAGRGLAARLVATDGTVLRINGWPRPEAEEAQE